MLATHNESLLHGVIVNVVQLLLNHRVRREGLGMEAFLPNLVLALDLMFCPVELELVKQPLAIFVLQLVQDFFAVWRFKSAMTRDKSGAASTAWK